jgi:ABC-type nitrate/sulfonate/bicarbonate transport system permease component
MIALGFLLGATLASPVFFAMGLFAGLDRARRPQLSYVRPPLRRSVLR